MPDLRSVVEQLEGSLKSIRQRWEQTSEIWDDEVAEHFEKDCWEPLQSQSKATFQALDQVTTIISKAQRDVK